MNSNDVKFIKQELVRVDKEFGPKTVNVKYFKYPDMEFHSAVRDAQEYLTNLIRALNGVNRDISYQGLIHLSKLGWEEQKPFDIDTKTYRCRYLTLLLTEIVNNHMAANPDHPFCIAMGDIDLFKQVNDTYGHNCGDQVLKSLAVLFVEKTIGLGHVCRWGGEEFFFFLPEMNLDEASELLNEIKVAVSKLPIMYNDEAHHVTMTFGVEEYDYRSSLEELVKRADDKLYYGKNHGRNQVVY